MECKELENRIKTLMGKEDRKDTEFRYLITATELGDIGKYITHDPNLNPNARPHGSKQDEILAYGQLFVQAIALCSLRDISLETAIAAGLKNWEDADWRKQQAKLKDKIVGITACYGYIQGQTYVVGQENKLTDFQSGIIVIESAKPEIAQYLLKASACVTDQGGKTCHVANIAREFNIPCVVGTGNATKLIKHKQIITLDARGEEGYVLFS